MTLSDPPSEGDEYSYERTFDREDVRDFGAISGDQQAIHTEPDDEDRLIVQGLLTATIPTKIGGDLNYIAREMSFEFHRPVRTGEMITCRMVVDTVTETDRRYEVECGAVCTNEDDEEVLSGTFDGIIRKEAVENG